MPRAARAVRWVDLAVKVALVSLLVFGAFSGLDRFAGKAFGWRLIGYSIAAGLVPAIWAIRGRRPPYPYLVDTLFVLPFLIDTIGNALDLYDTIDWWDDANHFVNWALLSSSFGLALLRTRLAPLVVFGARRRLRRASPRSSGSSASTSRSSATRRSSRPRTRTRSAT